jgi:hypothetical protein
LENSLCPNTKTIGVKLKPVLKNEMLCPAELSFSITEPLEMKGKGGGALERSLFQILADALTLF